MKKFLFVILFLSFLLPSFAEDELSVDSETEEKETVEQNENSSEDTFNQEKDEKIYHHLRNKAQVSPKKEHQKILIKASKALGKNKIKFMEQKNKQLWLLKEEYKTLEYTP